MNNRVEWPDLWSAWVFDHAEWRAFLLVAWHVDDLIRESEEADAADREQLDLMSGDR